ncbi:MAG: HAD family hydrolase [Pseudomonadota bacterium]
MPINAIIFDCDGVLVDSEALLLQADLESFSEIGLNYEPKEFHQKYLGTDNETYFQTLAREYKEHHGDHPPENVRDTFLSRRKSILEKELTAIKGVSELAANLKLKKAVASNTQRNEWLEKKLKMVGLYDVFAPHIYAAENVKNGKPAPDLYLYAAEQIGVDPKECLVIEDSPRGVQAAVAAGMSTIGFTGAAHVDEDHAAHLITAGATEVFSTMRAFEEYIELLMTRDAG